jgi:hypothetical protein
MFYNHICLPFKLLLISCLHLSSTVGGKQEQAFLAENPGYPAYTMDNCQLVDRQIQAVRWLNCSLIYFPPVPGTAFCSPLQTTKLYSNARQGTGRPHCRVVFAT